MGFLPVEKREQVFVSSTYIDLIDEREKVIQGLLEADCFPAGMEMFPASDDEKWDLIKGVIDDSDYYLLIIGGRYGAEDENTGLSYTEMEFDYALKQKKPIIAFVHAKPGKLAAEKTDQDDAKRAKLEAFRSKVQGRMVKMWTSGDQIPGFVAQALMKLRKTHPAVGWVRGDHALTPQKELEISELKREIESLRVQLAEKQSGGALIADLSEGQDEVELRLDVRLTAADDDGIDEVVEGYWPVAVTWDDVLTGIGPNLMQEIDEEDLEEELRVMLRRQLWTAKNKPDGLKSIHSATLGYDQLNTVLVQFRALNYIQHGQQRRPPSDKGKYWMLTEHGSDRLMQLRAIRKVDESVVNCDEVSAAIREKNEAE